MFSNPIERRRSKGKQGGMMATDPRRRRQNIVRSDPSSSEDSVIGHPPREPVPSIASALNPTNPQPRLSMRPAPNITHPQPAPSLGSALNIPHSQLITPQTGHKLGPLGRLLQPNLSTLLQERELGRPSRLSSRINIHSAIRGFVHHNPLTRTGSWVGASGDVLIAAWSPDGSKYAFGCSTDLDSSSSQYNRRNNLLLGEFTDATLRELPDHYVDRREALQSVQDPSTFSTLDPELYTTVTSVAFDASGDFLYTSSYDKTVKVWDVQSGKANVLNTLQHNAVVTHLVSSPAYSGSFVTGQSTQKDPVRVYTAQELNQPFVCLESEKAQRAKVPIYPSALKLGFGQVSQHLLVGFAGNNLDPNIEDKQGDICLWDLNKRKSKTLRSNSQTVFDLSWHPQLPLFAAATKPGNRSMLTDRYRTRSLVRIWEPLSLPSIIQEYECPASDINEVQFHPWDQNLIVASCTDGATYVWEYRMADKILHKFQHGVPIDELRHGISREEQDTGVRMAVWSQDGKRLLTGSSDGVIKSWNVFASPEDAFQGDSAEFSSGVMWGCWSPDHRSLLVGLAQGAIEILTSDPPDSDEDPKSIRFIPATSSQAQSSTEEDGDSGIATSRALLESEELVMHPIYGAGKGPNYAGPYAEYAHPVDPNGTVELDRLKPNLGILQLDSKTRRQARREGGVVERKAARKMYKEAETLARARNVEALGKFVEEREVVVVGEKRGREEEGRGERGGEGSRTAASAEDEAWEDPLEEDHWF